MEWEIREINWNTRGDHRVRDVGNDTTSRNPNFGSGAANRGIKCQGRALSNENGQGFVADVWMENDGMKLDRRDAHNLWQGQDHNITHIWSKKEAAKPISAILLN